mmetsp:Transcript_29820/g.88564  ORF Transcript_29820/g.88564 Transcript_29820/m.88564 type:complete len:294 (+) Transcript_29820:224-1105(+)
MRAEAPGEDLGRTGLPLRCGDRDLPQCGLDVYPGRLPRLGGLGRAERRVPGPLRARDRDEAVGARRQLLLERGGRRMELLRLLHRVPRGCRHGHERGASPEGQRPHGGKGLAGREDPADPPRPPRRQAAQAVQEAEDPRAWADGIREVCLLGGGPHRQLPFRQRHRRNAGHWAERRRVGREGGRGQDVLRQHGGLHVHALPVHDPGRLELRLRPSHRGDAGHEGPADRLRRAERLRPALAAHRQHGGAREPGDECGGGGRYGAERGRRAGADEEVRGALPKVGRGRGRQARQG